MSLELNRRDLLRFFGIGATIVPIIGGAAKLDSPARLVEEAKIEPVDIRTAARQFGAKLQIGDGMSPETFSTFDALSMTGPNMSAAGFRDNGMVTLSIVCDPKDVYASSREQLSGWLFVSRTLRTFRMVDHGDSSCTRWIFQGFIEQLATITPAGHMGMRDVTVRMTSRPNVSTAYWSHAA